MRLSREYHKSNRIKDPNINISLVFESEYSYEVQAKLDYPAPPSLIARR